MDISLRTGPPASSVELENSPWKHCLPSRPVCCFYQNFQNHIRLGATLPKHRPKLAMKNLNLKIFSKELRAVCDKFSFTKDNEGYLQARGIRSEVTVYYTFGLYLDQKSNKRVYYKYYTPKMQFQEFFLQDLMAGDILNRTVNNFRECFNVSAVELDLLEQHLNGSSRFNFGRLAVLFVLLNVMAVISNKLC